MINLNQIRLKIIHSNILKILLLAAICYGYYWLFKNNKITLYQTIIACNINAIAYMFIKNLNRRF